MTILPSQVLTRKQQCVNTPEPAVTHITFTASKYYHTASHRPRQVISNMHHFHSQRFFLPYSTSQTTARDFYYMAPPRPQPEISVTWHLTDHRFLSHSTPQTTARNPYYMAPHRPQPEIYTIHHSQGILPHGASH